MDRKRHFNIPHLMIIIIEKVIQTFVGLINWKCDYTNLP